MTFRNGGRVGLQIRGFWCRIVHFGRQHARLAITITDYTRVHKFKKKSYHNSCDDGG